MRQAFVFVCLLSVLALASAQRAFNVSELDRRCASPSDCAFIGTGCCSESNCNYAPVNVTMLPKYRDLLSSYLAANCANTPCTGALCMPPMIDCVFGLNTALRAGLCSFGGSNPPPPPPPTTNPCTPSTGANCESVCTSTATAPAMECLPDEVTACVNTCKNTLAYCAPLLSPNTGSTRQCGYVARDQTMYNACVDKCRLAPPPPELTCEVTTGGSCNKQCTAVGANVPTVDPAVCKPSPEVGCWNECQNEASCKATPLGCKFVPNNLTAYSECTRKCAPTRPTCLRTGCSGEICSAVAVASPCVFSCETSCYRNAICQADATGACGFAATTELEACLTQCKQNTPPPPPPPTDVCKISGCQRDLCVPSTEPDLGCPTTQLIEPTCEKRCLQYAVCAPSRDTLIANDANAPTTPVCGWLPDPVNPGLYGECLLKCRQPSNPCFVSGCGAVCSTVASLQPCTTALIAPDCYTQCKQQYTSCNMTNAGCLFVPVDGLRACYDQCAAATPQPRPSPCPTGLPQAECLVNPCDVTRCPANPNAKCTPDYCGGCRAVFTDANGNPVDCDGGCVGLPCGDCQKQASCTYCSGEYSVALPEGGSASKQWGVCVASAGIGTDRCINSGGQLLAASATCPVFTGVTEGSTASSGDVAPVQDAVAQDTRPVTQKWIIVISLIVNETTSKTDGFHLINMFVDLIGSGTPTATDKTEVCEILKSALTKVDSRVANAAAADLQCSLAERTSVKRDMGFVASLTFPNSQSSQAGAVTVALSLTALLASGLSFLF